VGYFLGVYKLPKAGYAERNEDLGNERKKKSRWKHDGLIQKKQLLRI
jgi:hypothetical protein